MMYPPHCPHCENVQSMPPSQWTEYAKGQVLNYLEELVGWKDLEGPALDHALALIKLFGDGDDDVSGGAPWQM